MIVAVLVLKKYAHQRQPQSSFFNARTKTLINAALVSLRSEALLTSAAIFDTRTVSSLIGLVPSSSDSNATASLRNPVLSIQYATFLLAIPNFEPRTRSPVNYPTYTAEY